MLQHPKTGRCYYYHRMSGQEQDEKPKGHVLCGQCNMYFATKRCVDPGTCSGSPYCDDCFQQHHSRNPTLQDHPTRPIPVRPAACKVCQGPAKYICSTASGTFSASAATEPSTLR